MEYEPRFYNNFRRPIGSAYEDRECSVPGCKNKGELMNYLKTGTKARRDLCTTHKRIKYKMPFKNQAEKSNWAGVLKAQLGGDVCWSCKWRGPCDIHRIIHGADGGRYTAENCVILCPNCHRLVHKGGIDITTLRKMRKPM